MWRDNITRWCNEDYQSYREYLDKTMTDLRPGGGEIFPVNREWDELQHRMALEADRKYGEKK